MSKKLRENARHSLKNILLCNIYLVLNIFGSNKWMQIWSLIHSLSQIISCFHSHYARFTCSINNYLILIHLDSRLLLHSWRYIRMINSLQTKYYIVNISSPCPVKHFVITFEPWGICYRKIKILFTVHHHHQTIHHDTAG